MNKQAPTAAELWDDVLAVRAASPLVHSVTNFVVTNFNANVLLALGASPVMAHAHEEVEQMASLAQAVVLNIGTLDPYWMESIRLALTAANRSETPTVLDPVGAGATAYRNRMLAELLEGAKPTVIRGNASEIMSLAGVTSATRGVDSTVDAAQALAAAKGLANALSCVVCVSGADDYIISSQGDCAVLSNGDPWMTRITGVGCSASAMVGAFLAVQPDAWRATLAAMAYLGVAGECAAQRVRARDAGVGSMQIELLDRLQLTDESGFVSRLKIRNLAIPD